MTMESSRQDREPFHYRHRTLVVGVFIAAAVSSIPLLLVITLINSDLFEKWSELTVQYDNVYSLQSGAAVNFQGVTIGKVGRVTLSDSGSVVVTMLIRQRYFPFISRGCRASLGQKNFVVGDWQINLARDTLVGAIQPGDRIPSVPPVPLDHAVEQITRMVSVVDSLFMKIQAGEGVLGRLFKEDTLVDLVEQFAVQASGILRDVNRTVGSANSMVGTLDTFGFRATLMVDTITAVALKAGMLVERLDTVATGLDSLAAGVQHLPAGIDSLVRGLRRDIDEAEILLKGIQDHWFFRRSVQRARTGQSADR